MIFLKMLILSRYIKHINIANKKELKRQLVVKGYAHDYYSLTPFTLACFNRDKPQLKPALCTPDVLLQTWM